MPKDKRIFQSASLNQKLVENPRWRVFDEWARKSTEKTFTDWEAAIGYKLHLLSKPDHGFIVIEDVIE
jgi:hypothetical protein